MADFPTAAVDRLGDYNGARYDAQTNPYGMAIGGHRINFPASLNDTALVVNYVGEAATEIAAFAQQTAADRVQTGQDRAAAAASAAAAATFNPALFAKLAGDTFTGLVSFFVGTPERAGLNIGQRASTPSTATNGDIWATASGLFYRIAGATRQAYDAVSLPRPTNALIDAGTDAVPKSWSVLDVFRAARGADPEVLVASYTGAQLVGLSQIVLDLPTGFSTFRVLIDAVGANPAGSISLRCGPAGGALHAGSSDYYSLVNGQIGSTSIVDAPTASAISLGDLTNNCSFQAEILITDGSTGGFWKALATTAGQVASGAYFNFDRYSFYQTAAGARKRLGIISTQPFLNAGNIRIYGVRP